MPHPRTSLTLLVALLAGCVAPPDQPGAPPSSREPVVGNARPTAGPGLGTTPSTLTPTAAPPRPGVTVRPGDTPDVPGPGPQAAGIIGKLKSPSGVVVANAGLGLATPAAAAYNLLALTQDGVAGATVSLVDADGKPVAEERATTDASGAFRFAALPPGDGTFFVQAEFEANGRKVALRTLAEAPEAGGPLELDIDPATTLAAAKLAVLIRRGQLARQAKAAARFLKLVEKVREALAPETLPYMGADSPDVVAAFDQLALDDAGIAKVAGALAAQAAEPAEAWTVGPAVDAARLRELGVLKQGAAFTEEGGVFAVDAQGRLHFATDSAPVRVVRLAEGGKAEEVATLPTDIQPPVSLAFAPNGELYAAGLDARTAVWICAGTGGVLAKRAGGPLFRTREEEALAQLGRLAVDAAGAIHVALPRAHVVLRFKPGQALPRVAAGKLGIPGYRDGNAGDALLRLPTSLATGPDGAIYVADTGNHCIRRLVEGADGTVAVETVAGQPGEAFYRNGRGAYARLGRPTALGVDGAGNLYVTDPGSRRVRRISPTGSVFLVAGTGEAGTADGPGWRASFAKPAHLAVAADGTLFTSDEGVGPDGAPVELVRKISPPPR